MALSTIQSKSTLSRSARAAIDAIKAERKAKNTHQTKADYLGSRARRRAINLAHKPIRISLELVGKGMTGRLEFAPGVSPEQKAEVLAQDQARKAQGFGGLTKGKQELMRSFRLDGQSLYGPIPTGRRGDMGDLINAGLMRITDGTAPGLNVFVTLTLAGENMLIAEGF